jgi:hypothetical protein
MKSDYVATSFCPVVGTLLWALKSLLPAWLNKMNQAIKCYVHYVTVFSYVGSRCLSTNHLMGFGFLMNNAEIRICIISASIK